MMATTMAQRKLFVIFALTQLLLLGSHHSCFALEDLDEEDDQWGASFFEVVELTDDSFDGWIAEHPRALVDFYASWCGHCKQLSPEMDKVAPILAASTPPVSVAKIDTDKHKKIGKQYSISQFPTIKIFDGGKPVLDYEGDRTAAAMVGVTTRLFFPDLTVLDASPTSFSTFLQETIPEGDDAPVFIVLGLLDEDSLEKLTLAAGKSKHAAYFVQHPDPPPELLKKLSVKVEDLPVLASFRPIQVEWEVFAPPFEVSRLDVFIRNNLLPLLTTLDGETYQSIATNGRHVALVITNGTRNSESSNFLKLCRKAAASHRNYTFASVDSMHYTNFVQQFRPQGPKATETWLPTIVVWDMDSKFFAPESFASLWGSGAETALDGFLTDVEQNKLTVKLTTGPTLWDKILVFVNSPNFPFYIVSLFMIAAIVIIRRFPDAAPKEKKKPKVEDEAPKLKDTATAQGKASKKNKGKKKAASTKDNAATAEETTSSNGSEQMEDKVGAEKKDD